MTAEVTVDVVGGPMGGAARYRDELLGYLARTGREDVDISDTASVLISRGIRLTFMAPNP